MKKWHIEFDLIDKPGEDDRPLSRKDVRDRVMRSDLNSPDEYLTVRNLKITEAN